tara:strand:- start:49 stop:327 length:279 start_codon:yes stop_codon:yes gene_type:complete
MAHFAEINDSNIVIRVVVIDNSDANTEANGIAKCKSLFGADTNWVQTSYNTYVDPADNVSKHKLSGTPFRKRYAGKGMVWDSSNQEFDLASE